MDTHHRASEGRSHVSITGAIVGSMLLMSAGAMSCGDGGNKANILPPDIQYMADTMFSHRKRAITKEMDSICIANSSMLIESAIDSFVRLEQLRIKEIRGDD